jgi:hypothetical protein
MQKDEKVFIVYKIELYVSHVAGKVKKKIACK